MPIAKGRGGFIQQGRQHAAPSASCAIKKPQVYNGNSEEYFCYECFEKLHSKGNRRSHRAMIVSVSDAEVVEPSKKCEECEDNLAAFRCDQCWTTSAFHASGEC